LERGRGIEKPRPVEMNLQASPVSKLRDLTSVVRVQYGSPAPIVSVLQADEPRDGIVRVIGTNGGLDF
jgi:hypothetical protein